MRGTLTWASLSVAAAVAAGALVVAAARTTPADRLELSEPSRAPVSVSTDALDQGLTVPAPMTDAAKDPISGMAEPSGSDPARASEPAQPIERSAPPVPAITSAAGAQAGQSVDSGVSGLVMLGSVCARPSEPTRCPAPLGATLSVLRPATGETVASVPIGPLGRFQIVLQPGPYVLRVVVPQQQSGPREATRAVTVKPHEFTLEVIRISSTLNR